MMQQSLSLTLSYQKLLFALLVIATLFIFLLPFASWSYAESTTLVWDANSENDMAGYKIYYSTNSAEGPFNGTGLAQGTSPISVGLSDLGAPTSPSFQVSGLTAGESYYFAVAAYNGAGTESDYSNVVSYDVPLPLIYFLTASATGQGSISPIGTVTVPEGSSKTFVIAADSNYHIADVIVDGTSVGPVNAYSFENISVLHDIQAVFEIDSFPVIASSSENGTISSEGETSANFGTSRTYTITPAENHHIADVIVDGTSVGPVSTYTFDNISAPHTIQAAIEIDTFSITTSTGDNGDISPEEATIVNFGSSQTFSITPDGNYHIADVIVSGISMGPVKTFTFDNIVGSHTIEATFEIDTFSITAAAAENGTITPDGSPDVACGSDQTYLFTPNAGYQIADVKVDSKSIGAVTEYTFSNMIENHIVEASFIEIITEFSMEVGEVSVGNNWQQVSFSRTFVHPVVVATSLGTNDSDPAVVRVDNVTSNGFEITVQEWDYLDDDHLNETIGYVVMEAGSFTLPDGTVVEAGTIKTNGTSAFKINDLGGKFTQVPVVVASVISYNDPDAVTVRLQNISTNSFEYQVQEQEANTDGHPSETVSYIAWEPCRTAFDGVIMEIAKTNDAVEDSFIATTFSQPFVDRPVFVASMQTNDGPNSASLRWDNRSTTGIQLKVEEEQSKDQETSHTSEVAGYFAFAPEVLADTDKDGLPDSEELDFYGTDPNILDTDLDGIADADEVSYWGVKWNADFDMDGIINLLDQDADGDLMIDGEELAEGYDPADAASKPFELQIEFGEVVVNHNWKKIVFNQGFVSPVVVASSLSMNGGDPSTVRIDNVTSTGFEISVQEWDYLNGFHAEEHISYVVMEAGSFTLPDGTVVEAGTFTADGASTFKNTALSSNFNQAPVVIASVASYNDPDAVTVRLQNISSTDFEYRVQEQEVNKDGHRSETVSYIAWEPCRTALNGAIIEVGNIKDTIGDEFEIISFSESFTEAPYFLAAMQTYRGSNTAALRWDNRSTDSIQLKVEEEQSRDSETKHDAEAIGYFAISME